MQKIKPLVDDDKLLSLVYSEELRTDSDGYLSKDIIIPDDWLPTPIFLTVGYGYDRREELSGGEIKQAAMEMWVGIVLEVLVFSLVFQALINMLVSVGIMPVTGQTLPLISMGGTSLVFTFIALGIVLSVSNAISIFFIIIPLFYY